MRGNETPHVACDTVHIHAFARYCIGGVRKRKIRTETNVRHLVLKTLKPVKLILEIIVQKKPNEPIYPLNSLPSAGGESVGVRGRNVHPTVAFC
jgi:delta-aminolevulinic acid dehydratase/porphobilinogen synthase